ncbi:flagellar biosynthetic protein FliO [Acidovorax sp. GBBC 3334]|uniref:flagellar biosynthetic protein FliO n=1 Tax=Acidovorax sp. GBBC 3334 TaxID=2940496 RepID=UPI002303E27C|nr:flagellar biosynthetic protein FliO [Acidovorax sp. GBBC 3334]MDA8456967.1 flagellar biosynthetic protein FliO [Acidovorax sp. GBBC 3334]
MAFPESIPLRREPDGASTFPATELAWLGVFVLLIALFAGVWRKHRATRQPDKQAVRPGALGQWIERVQQRTGRTVEVVSSVRLTPQHSVHEVQWHGRRILIGCAPQAINVLADGAGPEKELPGLGMGEELP